LERVVVVSVFDEHANFSFIEVLERLLKVGLCKGENDTEFWTTPRPEVDKVFLIEGAHLGFIELSEFQLQRCKPDLFHFLLSEVVVLATIQKIEL
jgi:hypothetical protein